jgi:hypothetical protein
VNAAFYGAVTRRSSQQFFNGDRQVAHPLAGRAIDRIGDRGRHQHSSQLAEAFGAERARLCVEFTDDKAPRASGSLWSERTFTKRRSRRQRCEKQRKGPGKQRNVLQQKLL